MKTERLDIRITTEEKELIKYAFEISGKKNISDFITDILINESNRIINENIKIKKILDDKRSFVEKLSLSSG
jgi:uncharacterized protein (DUF1778 family)